MSIAVVILVFAAFVAAILWSVRAAERTDSASGTPAIWWLALTAVFFGIGSARLAIDGGFGPAAYVSGAVLAFALAVAWGDRLARRRAAHDEPLNATQDDEPQRRSPCGHGSLAVSPPSGLALIAPTILRSGFRSLPATSPAPAPSSQGCPSRCCGQRAGARPRLVLGTRGRGEHRHRTASPRSWLAVGLLIALDIILASRYLVAELLAVLLVGIGLAGWRLQPRRLAALALIAVLAFGGIQILRSYDQAAGRELAFAVERTINRVVLIQPRTLEALQAAIPAEQTVFRGA
jgi:hypothetical protein